MPSRQALPGWLALCGQPGGQVGRATVKPGLPLPVPKSQKATGVSQWLF